MQMGREYTIRDFIKEYKEETLSFDTLHFKEVFKKRNGDNVIILSDSILTKYNNELLPLIVPLHLNDSEYNKFQYNPKLLSYELYGTTELWQLLLHANEIFYIGQFSMNPIKVYTANVIDLINRIITIEEPIININKYEVDKKIMED